MIVKKVSRELYENLKKENRIVELDIEGLKLEQCGALIFIEDYDEATEKKVKEYNKNFALYVYGENKEPDKLIENSDGVLEEDGPDIKINLEKMNKTELVKFAKNDLNLVIDKKEERDEMLKQIKEALQKEAEEKTGDNDEAE